MNIYLKKLIDQSSLTFNEAIDLMNNIVSGSINDIKLSSILTSLAIKGESTNELMGFAQVMHELSIKVPIRSIRSAVDVVGTGGDGLNTFNISTTSAFVAAGCGVTIAKHGNRSSSGLFGSADLLEALGVNLTMTPEQVGNCIDELGIGFMFAPNHHPAMKHVRQVRKDLGFRTIFNLLGPLTNPSNTKQQLIGVFNKKWMRPMAECFKSFGSKHCLIVNAEDGLDELSCFSTNNIIELKNNQLMEYTLDPDEFDLESTRFNDIVISNIKDSVEIFHDILSGKHGAARNIVLLNAGATVYCSGLAESIADGIAQAKISIDSGKAKKCFENLLKRSNNVN